MEVDQEQLLQVDQQLQKEDKNLKMKKVLTYLLVVLPFLGLAQNSTDALRYSRTEYLGTARFNALGGSMGAIGGDLSSIVVNPAGLGIYRNSEFTFSTDFFVRDVNTNYRGSSRQDNKVNFNIGNIGYVGNYKGDPNGWKSYSFAIGYNKLGNFNSQSRLLGNNPNSSIVDDYVLTLNSNNASTRDVNDYGYDLGPSEAYWVYLIDSIGQRKHQRTLNFQDNIEQKRRTETSGRHGETFFSFGGNYLDRFYLGGTIGFQSIRYEESTIYQEFYTYDPPALPTEFLAKEYEEERNLITSGTGINFKVGFIYRITNSFRVGGGIHSPTFFGMTETYSFESRSKFSDGTDYESEATEYNYDYRLRTPTKYNASIAYVFKDKALINLDYEHVNYASSRLNDVAEFEFDFSESNDGIDRNLKGVNNIRVGGEYRLEPFVVRAGIRYEDNPYASNLTFDPDESKTTLSLGTGFRSKNYNIDVTYMNSSTNRIDPVYNTSEEAATIDGTNHHLMFTVGWKW